MKTWKKWLIGILSLILIVGGVSFWDKQAPTYEKHSIENQEALGEDSLFVIWLESYLDLHLEPLNLRAPLDNYKVEIVHYNTYYDSINEYSNYHVKIKGESRKAPNKLFDTAPFYEGDRFSYDLFMSLRFEEEKVTYLNDKPYEKQSQQMEEIYRPDAKDPLGKLFSKDSMNLKVRETVDSPWIETPIEVSRFQTQSGGWYRNDQRIYFEDDEIAILHNSDNEKMALNQSHDKGKTWTRSTIMKYKGLGDFSIPFAYVGFVGDEGVVVLSSAIAGRSEIMSMYKTMDNGDTWEAGIVPEGSRSPYAVSFIDQGRIFVTANDDPLLYLTEDLGETYETIKIPDHELDYDLLHSSASSLVWSDFYVQAEAPFIIDDAYYMIMNQGENGDYNKNAGALYVSLDKGKTWEFKAYQFPVEAVEEN